MASSESNTSPVSPNKTENAPSSTLTSAAALETGTQGSHVAHASSGSDIGDFRVWNPPKSSTATPADSELPDSYFEPTAAELQAAFQAQTRARERLLEAPLKTKEIRDREEKLKADRWPNTTIRIKFPNQTQLEKTFPSTDKIKSVYAFVRNSLTEETKPIKFVLYQAPKRELKVSDPLVKPLSLYELQLAPSSILLLRFEDDALNGSQNLPPLLPDVLARSIDLPPPPSFESRASAQPQKDKGKARSSGSGSTSKPGVPKWLKLGK